MSEWSNIDCAPKHADVLWGLIEPGKAVPMVWERTLFKKPIPFLQWPKGIEPDPVLMRMGSWRHAHENEVIGWATRPDEPPIQPYAWKAYETTARPSPPAQRGSV